MDIAAIARASGVVGAGGAGFPSHVKWAAGGALDCFIVNAAECEPLLQTDQFLMRTRADDLVQGAALIGESLGAKAIWIALKAKYTREIEALNAAIGHCGAPVRLHIMSTYYPAGDEQLMVQEITGKSVPERGIPLRVGAVVNNVATVLHLWDAMQGTPVLHKVFSVTGAVREPILARAPIGTIIAQCLEAAQPLHTPFAVWLGGPMMGRPLSPEEVATQSLTKTDSNLLILPTDHPLILGAKPEIRKLKNRARSACIQCRMCTDLCPRFLIGHNMQPHLVMRNLYRLDDIPETENEEFLAAFGCAANCSECGVCEVYSCPMLLSPRRVNQEVKARLRRRGLNPPANEHPVARAECAERRVSTARIIARLGLSAYAGTHAEQCVDIAPARVRIPLKMHIGAPAVSVVQTGERVEAGQLIAEIPEGALGARVHASLSGRVTVEATAITIEGGTAE